MPNRGYQGSGYRYGFNGKENDGEVSGNGNQYDYGFRIYNPRLGRFLSVDPLSDSYYTPYQFAGNKPIRFIDLDGKEEDTPIMFKETEKAIVIGFNVNGVKVEISLTQTPPFRNIQTPQNLGWFSVINQYL